MRDEICEEVGELCREKKNADCSATALRNLFESFRTHRHAGRFDEATDCLRDLLTRSLLAAAKEYKQMGHCRDLGTVQSRLYHGFKTYENRGKFQRRMEDIQQSLAAVVGKAGVITQTEKMELAESYEKLAGHCLKAVITMELEQQKQEQHQTPEMVLFMAQGVALFGQNTLKDKVQRFRKSLLGEPLAAGRFDNVFGHDAPSLRRVIGTMPRTKPTWLHAW